MPDSQIDLSTFGGALKHGYRITAHCQACSRYEDLDLTRYPPDLVFVGRRFRCGLCGAVGSISVSQIASANPDAPAALEKWRGR